MRDVAKGFSYAKDVFGELGVDVEQAMQIADRTPISMHCWQGDDIKGLDGAEAPGGGIAAIGNHPGRARNAQELRSDLDMALSLIPGTNRVNLHASYAEPASGKVDRNEITIADFEGWIAWANGQGVKLDFNTTFFGHANADAGFTLASADKDIAKFWLEHGKRCRAIAAEIGKRQGSACVLNHWMPDGFKDIPADTKSPRQRMTDALDAMLVENYSKEHLLDCVESKLFGLGFESFTVASHEYSLLYAQTRDILYTLDAGHFHPTEVISAKFSAIMQFMPELMLHVSRGVRWDSDHVIVLDDELQNIMREVVRGDYLERIHIGLDYFDASINRVAAWVIGMRNARKALLFALLEPYQSVVKAEQAGDYTARLALGEEMKTLPFGAVWDQYCTQHDMPLGKAWVEQVQAYEKAEQMGRI